ncbi:SPOR domain-containing protein [Kangiella sediminilitoris]|uniref:Sporulation domain protein n=1 Tax=Kangiella sediminilitoris TaxID=1144748 RepID=A0A1B3BA87_9GAMM|nr:SPOR domain-containing protein [Kangiella sediminilitoris]AOE49731.1 Sporulation domain protein [Kangiella sediminilitoris]
MDIKLKHRLVGACVILALAVFFLPMILDSEKYRSDIKSQIPATPTLQSSEPEVSVSNAEDSGSLTINLDEDEPQKAIEEPVSETEGDKTSSVTEQSEATTKESKEELTEANKQEGISKQEPTSEGGSESNLNDSIADTNDNSGDQVVEDNRAADKEPTENAPSQSTETNFEGQPWVIQIGSFSNKDNATGLIADLRDQGYRAYQRQSGKFTRVFVGPYPDKEAALERQPGLEKIIGTPVKLIEFDAGEH